MLRGDESGSPAFIVEVTDIYATLEGAYLHSVDVGEGGKRPKLSPMGHMLSRRQHDDACSNSS